MCRRYIIAFCVCLSLLVSCSFCLADCATDGTSEIMGEAPLYELWGFSDEQSFYDFCSFLSQFSGTTVEDMQSYLDLSIYSDSSLNAEACLQLFDYLNTEYGIDLLATGADYTFTSGFGQLTIQAPKSGSSVYSNTYIFKNIPGTYPNWTVDFSLYPTKTEMNAAISAAVANSSSAWTSSQATTVTNNTNTITSNTNTMKTSLTNIYNALYNFPYVVGNDLSTQSIQQSVYSTLMNTGTLISLIRDTTRYGYFNYSGVTSVTNDGQFNSVSQQLADMNNTLYWTLGQGNAQYNYFTTNSAYSTRAANSASISTILSHLNTSFVNANRLTGASYLSASGVNSFGTISLADLIRSGFSGFNKNMEAALVGSHGETYYFEDLLLFDENLEPISFDSSPGEFYETGNILDAITKLAASIQRPVSQLQAVLANDDDLELRRQTQEQVESVKDNFTGEGSAAPSLDNISDAAGISTGITGTFDTGVSIGEGFGILQAEGSFSFFSQAVSDDLNGTGISPFSDDDFLDDYEFDEDGFAVLKDQSEFSISDFLGRDLQ